MNTPRLSIAMCTYNGGRFLREQMDSIASQTRTADELIVCDDGSTDETLAILEAYAKAAQFPARIHRNVDRLGPAKNFEQAISLCRGDIIVLCDQDDIWRPDRLQILERILFENPDAGYAFSDAVVVDEKGKIIDPSLWELVSFSAEKQALFSGKLADQITVLIQGNVVTGATMAVRASVRATALPVAESWVHDEWIAFASSVRGARGIPVSEPLIRYRRHRSQAIGVRGADVLQEGWGVLMGAPRAYESELRKTRAAYALIKDAGISAPGLLQFLGDKVAHLRFRAKLYERPRWARGLAIGMELVRGGYHHFSFRYWSVLKDLLIPPVKETLY